MEKEKLHKSELVDSLSNRKIIRKTDLRDFYKTLNAELSEKTFRRILYALEKLDIIQHVSYGYYIFGTEQALSPLEKKFIPSFSTEIRALSDSIKAAFPYTEYLIWETRVLHEFMLHQPGQNQIILETEKETAETIFNFLNDKFIGKVFLRPNREIIERYALHNADSIIISTLLIQAPIQRVNNIPSPKLEKILVDIFAEDEKFILFQGQELIHIYETAFHAYWISEKTLFRYAQRRKVYQKLRAFISKKTDIQLIQQEEAYLLTPWRGARFGWGWRLSWDPGSRDHFGREEAQYVDTWARVVVISFSPAELEALLRYT